MRPGDTITTATGEGIIADIQVVNHAHDLFAAVEITVVIDGQKVTLDYLGFDPALPR